MAANESLIAEIGARGVRKTTKRTGLDRKTIRAILAGKKERVSFVSDTTPTVFVLDEDPSVHESLELLIRREGWGSETFASAREFLV
jgi:hypothetical protein